MKTTEKNESKVAVENLVVSSNMNVFGWYTASAFVNGYLLTVRFDRKPTMAAAKSALIEFLNNY